MKLEFKFKSFVILSICFILFTAIGTVSHEYGHVIAAKAFGHSTVLHYGSMNYYPAGYLNDKDYQELINLKKKYVGVEKKNWKELDLTEFKNRSQILNNKYGTEWKKGSRWIRVGGPLQTILTGILGLVILFFRKVQIRTNGLKPIDWLAVFLSLFWLRQVFNVLFSFGHEILEPNGTWFSGDEYYLSKELGIWSGSISIATAIVGSLIVGAVIFVIVPKNLRLTFIASGINGSLMGFILWMEILGPKLLP